MTIAVNGTNLRRKLNSIEKALIGKYSSNSQAWTELSAVWRQLRIIELVDKSLLNNDGLKLAETVKHSFRSGITRNANEACTIHAIKSRRNELLEKFITNIASNIELKPYIVQWDTLEADLAKTICSLEVTA